MAAGAFKVVMKIKGIPNLNKELEALAKDLDGARVMPALKAAAKVIHKEVRSKTPKGPTGNLRKGIKIVMLKRSGNMAPRAVVKSTAPHRFWIEEGTRDRKPTRGQIMVGKQDNVIYGRSAKGLRKNPTFWPAVRSKEKEALEVLRNGIAKVARDSWV